MSVNKPVKMNGFWDWNLISENLFDVVFPTDAKRLGPNFTDGEVHRSDSEIRT